MSDYLREAFGRIFKKYLDVGDGTHAEVVALGSPIDSVGNAIISIGFAHYEIHDGDTFFTSYKSPDGANIADNGTIDFVITTGEKYCHALAFVAMGGDIEAALYEGPTFDPDGTSLTVYNRNRASNKTTTATVVRDPTVTNTGDQLEIAFVPGGTGGNALGDSKGQRNEWILDKNTSYLYRIINRAGNAQPGSLELEWYEKSTGAA